MTIDYNTILERCKQQTAYFGRTAEQTASDALRGESGETAYSPRYIGHFQRIRIRGSDHPLIFSFIAEGARWLESRLRWAMNNDGLYNDTSVNWNFMKNTSTQDNAGLTDTTKHTNSANCLKGLVEDTLVAYVLHRWLADKLPEYADFFSNQTTILLQSIMKNTTTLQQPRKYHPRENH